MREARYRYVALLRAVNVGGHSVVKMSELRALFESLGLEDVATFIQSGNVLFTAREPHRERLRQRLEDALEAALKQPVAVFVLTLAELQDAAAHNPFVPAPGDSVQQSHLMFLSAEPAADRCAALLAKQGDDYRFHVHGPVLYYAYWRGRTRRTVNFEKLLGVTGTARSWKVVDRLIELLRGG